MLKLTLTDFVRRTHPHRDRSKEIATYKTNPLLSPVNVREGKEEKRGLLLQGICDRVSLSGKIGGGD